jgi:uncharacterized protein (UPF0332 family)
MDGRAFLSTARQLVGSRAEEDWRTAASRAYYALFLECREALHRWGFVISQRDRAHAEVRLRFSYAADPDLKHIGTTLDRLSQLRNRADYDLAPAPWFLTNVEAKEAVTKADKAIALLDQSMRTPHGAQPLSHQFEPLGRDG